MPQKIRIGVGYAVARNAVHSAEEIMEYGELLEDLGIDSVWPSDHIVSRQPSLDVNLVMAFLAARTKKLKMGPSVLTMPSRHPIHVAKTYATLDHLTGGRRRIILAVGLGADRREVTSVGIPTEARGARMREGVEILRRLFTEKKVTHQGRFYQFEDVTIDPQPVGGSLDIWLGGNSDLALKRVARYGDGWMPSFITPGEFAAGIEKLTGFATGTGRKVDQDEAGVLIPTHVTDDAKGARALMEKFLARAPVAQKDFAERYAIGSAEAVRERVAAFAEKGCTKFILFPIGAADLKEQAQAIGKGVVPHFS
ncbi:MAG: LLM class flavin-dependent oxidoreductase [Deltaproteobacteria bacterium]